jgi:hypothetical protein
MAAITMTATETSHDIPIGARVVTADGERLGKLTQADAWELLVERGFFIRHTYALNMFDVDRYDDGTLHLKLTADEVAEQRVVG